VIDPDSLVRAEVRDGRLCVAQMQYRVLVLPGVQGIRRDALAKVVEFAKSGRVLVVQRWPEFSAEAGQGDELVKQGIAALQAAGVKPMSHDEAVQELMASLPLDLVAPEAAAVRYRHVRKEGLDLYFVVNSSRQPVASTMRFRAVGAPALWSPEDGSIQPVADWQAQAGFSSLALQLDPWQGVFVVFDPTDTRVPQPASDANVPVVTNVQELTGPWQFLAVGKQLDHVWSDRVATSEPSLPTARIRWERPGDEASAWSRADCDDSRWREVKILDTLHPEAGATRYRSHWRGQFVSYYDTRTFHAKHGGKDWRCRTQIDIPKGGDGWLVVVADGAFTLKVGDKEFSGDRRRQPVRFELKGLGAGKTSVEFRLKGGSDAVLIEGELAGVPVFTDHTWQVSRNGRDWRAAAEYVAPPEKPYGDPAHPGKTPLPSTVWYRLVLPPGTVAVRVPSTKAQAWVDGKPLAMQDGWIDVPSGSRVLALRIDDERGLITPPSVRCQPSSIELGSWTEQGLAWYSGRALYEKTFTVTPAQLAAGGMELDLGEVDYCAEIWLNGELVGTRVWPPYRMALGDHVQAGENRLVVVVANLLANRMRWDIFDDAKANPTWRKWHDANLLRDGWCFRSGLVGPVLLESRTGL
jgi:hypothetical protein